MKGKSIRHTDNHVDGGSGYDTAHQWVEGMLLEYLLTGDRRSLEVAREMGVPLIAFAHDMNKRLTTKPNTLPTTERNLGWTLMSLMFLEEVTGDRPIRRRDQGSGRGCRGVAGSAAGDTGHAQCHSRISRPVERRSCSEC